MKTKFQLIPISNRELSRESAKILCLGCNNALFNYDEKVANGTLSVPLTFVEPTSSTRDGVALEAARQEKGQQACLSAAYRFTSQRITLSTMLMMSEVISGK